MAAMPVPRQFLLTRPPTLSPAPQCFPRRGDLPMRAEQCTHIFTSLWKAPAHLHGVACGQRALLGLRGRQRDRMRSYPSFPRLWMASSSPMPSSSLKLSQSSLDFSRVLIFCFLAPIFPKRLLMPLDLFNLGKAKT